MWTYIPLRIDKGMIIPDVIRIYAGSKDQGDREYTSKMEEFVIKINPPLMAYGDILMKIYHQGILIDV